jgi:hypothetical protein
VQETSNKITKVSLNWAKLLARIYEVNPLLCICGREMKIVAIVTHPTEIGRILSGIGWPTHIPEFDPPYYDDENVSQLVIGTVDGFPSIMEYDQFNAGPDPPQSDLSQWENESDPPHWEDLNYISYD